MAVRAHPSLTTSLTVLRLISKLYGEPKANRCCSAQAGLTSLASLHVWLRVPTPPRLLDQSTFPARLSSRTRNLLIFLLFMPAPTLFVAVSSLIHLSFSHLQFFLW